jgi:hypothetical protein
VTMTACSAAGLDAFKESVAAAKGERKSEARERGGDTQPSRLPTKFDGGFSILRQAISPCWRRCARGERESRERGSWGLNGKGFKRRGHYWRE